MKRLPLYQKNQNRNHVMSTKKGRGRPVKQPYQYAKDYYKELDLMDKFSLREVSRITKTSTTTLLKLKKMFIDLF